jgi:hypothetical protein
MRVQFHYHLGYRAKQESGELASRRSRLMFNTIREYASARLYFHISHALVVVLTVLWNQARYMLLP